MSATNTIRHWQTALNQSFIARHIAIDYWLIGKQEVSFNWGFAYTEDNNIKILMEVSK